jgi:hypothetical protein
MSARIARLFYQGMCQFLHENYLTPISEFAFFIFLDTKDAWEDAFRINAGFPLTQLLDAFVFRLVLAIYPRIFSFQREMISCFNLCVPAYAARYRSRQICR